jgi:hypothetical protein
MCEFILRQLAHAAVGTLQAQHQTALHLDLRSLKFFSFDTFGADSPNLSTDEIYNTIHFLGPRCRIHRDHATV